MKPPQEVVKDRQAAQWWWAVGVFAVALAILIGLLS